MKTFILSVCMITSLSISFAQDISGVWYTETDQETTIFDHNGNFLIHWEAKDLNAAGTYSFNGNTLKCSFQDGEEQTYSISQLVAGQSFMMTDVQTGQNWWYSYQGDADLIATREVAHTEFITLADFSGTYFCASEQETIVLSPSEYFEAKTSQQQSYGIWGIAEGKLGLAFANYGTMVHLPITDFAKGRYFTLQLEEENGKQTQKTYVYQGGAPTYSQAQVQQVIHQYTNKTNLNYQTQLQIQNSMHNTTMSIINAMGGNGTEYIVRDAYGNEIRRY